MAYAREDVYDALDGIGKTLDSLQGRVANIREMLAAGAMTRDETDKIRCPVAHCGVEYGSEDRMRDHLRNVHGAES